MNETTTTHKPIPKRLCDACRKIIRDDQGNRLINGYTLHLEDYCFYLYTEKVSKGILKVEYRPAEKKR